jgi:hypothetical protein
MKKKAIFFVFLLSFLIFSGWEIQAQLADGSQDFANAAWREKSIKVMTRNIYVGGNVDRVIEATTPGELLAALEKTLDELVYTYFPNRAEALAMEIKQWNPDLVSLDYESIFMQTLDAMGCKYNVAGKVQNTDATVFLDATNYVRLIDYDMTIAREDVGISNVRTGNYFARFPVPSIGVDIIRGWVAVDAEVNGRKYCFVNTHLEPFVPEVKMGQAVELLSILESETLPIICVGDFNAPVPKDPVYRLLVKSDLVDTWKKNLFWWNRKGLTSGFEPTLDDPNDTLETRIDLIFVRSHVWFHRKQIIGPVFAVVVGDEPQDMHNGFWPSDHAGVVARLTIPR